MTEKGSKRWHFWYCFQGEGREEAAKKCIEELEKEGRRARIWSPLPQHKTSGHTHVVVLCTLNEYLHFSGILAQELERGGFEE